MMGECAVKKKTDQFWKVSGKSHLDPNMFETLLISKWQILRGGSGIYSLPVHYPLSLCSSHCLAVICTVLAACSGHISYCSGQ